MKQDNPRAVYASFLIVCSKSAVHKDAVIRRKIARRIREAIKLIITRGAQPNETGSGISFAEKDIGEEKWLLPGHSYVVFAQLEAYRTPWPDLLKVIRDLLYNIKQKSRSMDRHSRPLTPSKTSATKPKSPLDSVHRRSLEPYKKPVGSSSPSPSLARTRPPSSPSSGRQFSTGPSQSKIQGPVGRHSDSEVLSASFGSTYLLPPENDYRSHRRRQMYRAEIVLGQHSFSPAFFHLFPDQIDTKSSLDMLPSVVHPTRPEVVKLGDNVPGSIPIHWVHDPSTSLTSAPIHMELGEASDDLAEGYVLYQPANDSSADPFDEEVCDILPLLDAATLLRYRIPHLPHHPGAGLEVRFRRNQHSYTSLDKTSESGNDMKQEFDRKMSQAVIQRRKQRRALRARWNTIDPAWLEKLKWREERRLENLYQIKFSDVEKYGLDLGRPNGRNEEVDMTDADVPWWKPRREDFGWDKVLDFEGKRDYTYRPLVPRPKWSERPPEGRDK